MQNDLMKKCIKLSRILVTLTVFVILNAWLLFENSPYWTFSTIVSVGAFLISFPSSKVCIFLINKSDKIKNKIVRILFYLLGLPIIFIIFLLLVAQLCGLITDILFPVDSISLGTAIIIAFVGIGILTYSLVPYYQTIIILIIRYFFKLKNKTDE